MSYPIEKTIEEKLIELEIRTVELEKRTTIEKPSGISRIRKLTYGLIYPAFIGNMIYDLVQFIFDEDPEIKWVNIGMGITTGIFLVIFYTLDYIILHSDLEYKTSAVERDWIYVGCDFATSFLFFLSFVFSKYGNINGAVICIGIVPLLFAIYNSRLNNHKKLHIGFAIINSLIVIYYFAFHCIFKKDSLIIHPEIFFFFMALVYTGAYFIYNLVCFWLLSISNSKE